MSKLHSDGILPDRMVKSVTFDDREPASTALTARPHICVTKTIAGGGEFVIDLKESTYGPGLTEFIDVRVKTRDVNMYVDRNDIGDGSVGSGNYILLFQTTSDYKLFRFPIVTDYIRFDNTHHAATPVVTVFIKLKEAE